MRALFKATGCLCLWAILLCTFSLSVPLAQLAAELGNFPIQDQVNTILDQINQFVPQLIQAIPTAVPLPDNIPLPGDNGNVTNNLIYGLFGVLLMIGALAASLRAAKSKGAADDFVALVALYFALRIASGIWATAFPGLMDLQDETIALFMFAWIIYAMRKAKGMDDSKVFFRGIVQLVIIGLFTFPVQTREGITDILRMLSRIGGGQEFSTLLQGAALVGILLAAYVLYGAGKPPSKSTNQVLEDVRKDVNEMIDKAKSKE